MGCPVTGRPGRGVTAQVHITLPHCIDGSGVSIRLDIGTAILRTTPDDARRAAAEEHLGSLPDGAIWIWCDGSAEGWVAAGGSGALIDPPSDDSVELRAAAGEGLQQHPRRVGGNAHGPGSGAPPQG